MRVRYSEIVVFPVFLNIIRRHFDSLLWDAGVLLDLNQMVLAADCVPQESTIMEQTLTSAMIAMLENSAWAVCLCARTVVHTRSHLLEVQTARVIKILVLSAVLAFHAVELDHTSRQAQGV